jgi:hypothetical protein
MKKIHFIQCHFYHLKKKRINLHKEDNALPKKNVQQSVKEDVGSTQCS